MSFRVTSALVVLAVLAVVATPVAGAAGERHSGTVVATDLQDGVLVIDEVGPWRVRQGATVTTRRTIGLTAETRFNLFMRAHVPGAFAGGFIEVALEAEDVAPGDFVTADCVREGGRLMALGVTVAELSGQ